MTVKRFCNACMISPVSKRNPHLGSLEEFFSFQFSNILLSTTKLSTAENENFFFLTLQVYMLDVGVKLIIIFIKVINIIKQTIINYDVANVFLND